MSDIQRIADDLKYKMCKNCEYFLSLKDGFVCGRELNNNNTVVNGRRVSQVNVMKDDDLIKEIPWNCPYKLEHIIVNGEYENEDKIRTCK